MTARARAWSAAAALAALALGALLAQAAPPPPHTRAEAVRDTLHGVVLEDPYRWLEDQDAPATREWLAEQERYRRAVMDAVPGRIGLRDRLAQLLRTDDVGLPTVRGERAFFLRRGPEQDQRVLMLRPGPDRRDEVLFDPHPLSGDHSISVRLLDVTADGSLAAIGLQRGGEDEVTVRFLDVATRRLRPDSLPRARYQGVQFGDGGRVYYSRVTADGPRAFRHAPGADPARDELVFGAGLDRGKLLGARVSDDAAWLLLTVSHGSAGDQVEVYVKDLRSDGPVRPIVRDLKARFQAAIGGETLYLQTQWEAPLGRILAVDLAHPERERWREVVKQAAHPIERWTLSGGRLLVEYFVDGVSQVIAFGPDGALLGPVPVGDGGAVREMRGRWSDADAFLTHETFLEPARILRVRAATAAVSEWYAPGLPFAADSLEMRIEPYVSKDGTRVAMYLAMRRGLPRDGSHPLLLTGYGGFAQNQTPRFGARHAVWLENGGILAVPMLRGGAEKGEAWHRAGMLENKQNVFDDFIAAAEHLVARGYTSPGRLAIAGGSNGGLLVGAAMTQRPDLFRAVVCSFPLLDMLRYQCFLVARYWVPEYGSSEDPQQFRFLRAYSPYHHVSEGVRYPATLLVSGDADTRVAPLHARKMTALLQARRGGDAPVLLQYDTRAGHSGGKAATRQVEDEADILQFLFWQCGMAPPPPGGRNVRPSPSRPAGSQESER